MSDYPYRAYSPSKHSASPTRRTPIIPPAGSAPGGGRYAGAGSAAGLGEGFEGWYDGSLSYAANNAPPLPPRSDIPSSLQPARGSVSSLPYDRDRDLDLAFGSEPTKRGSVYTSGTPDRGREAPTFRRRIRTPSTSSTESIPRSRRSDRSNRDRDRTPSRSPSRAINNPIIHTTRTPSGNIMTTIFNSQNAAVVGNAVGAAANFLGNRLRPVGQEQPPVDDYDRTPGGFNNRPASGVPDTTSPGFTLNDALGYLGNLAGPQTPEANQPAQSPGAGGGFNLGSALSYLQNQTGAQQNAAGGNTGPGGLPQRFQLAGVEIDLNWIMKKAGEQNPWVLLGGGVVAFWIISSIIATLMWYAVVAGVLYVVYIVGVKNGGFSAIGGSPDRRRVGGGAGSGTGYGGRPAVGAPAGRRRY